MTEQQIHQEMWSDMLDESKDIEKLSRPNLTYSQHVWIQLKKNRKAMLGLTIIMLMTLVTVIVPFVYPHDHANQQLIMANMPPKLDIYQIDADTFIYMHREYNLYEVTQEGVLSDRIKEVQSNLKDRNRVYEINGKKVVIDYAYAAMGTEENPEGIKFKLLIDDIEAEVFDRVPNKRFVWGTDSLGRDIFARVLHGGRITLLIALVATSVNFVIGVLYGGFSGYIGGRVDNIMMRIVDTISVIPLLLYVILLSVIIGSGLKSIIIALGLVYWVGIARIVRGQVMSLKGQEYVLAAKTLGQGTGFIILRHLIPNAMGPILVALTMLIPSAIFTEAFLGFIGLGVNPPMASLGTLINEAIGGLRSYPYQLFYPSMVISLTMLSYNLIGDGLRDALDPRLR